MTENYEKAKAWRESLKSGDEVVVTEGGNYRYLRKSIAAVERVTATQIIVGDRDRRFNKTYGREVGTAYGATISPVTEKDLADIRASKNRSEFTTIVYRPDSLSDEEIGVMLDAIYSLRASKKRDTP